LYLNFTDKYWACDIEADDLSATTIWCLCAVNIVTGEEISRDTPQRIKSWVDDRLAEGCKFIFHNVIGFDAPTLNRLLKTKIGMNSLIDTMMMSMLYSPSLDGGHSLGAWGNRLRFPKGDFHDFSHLSDEMLEYCLQDARLCRRVYIELVRRMIRSKFSEKGVELEHKAWQLIKKQKDNGFHFNIKEANILYSRLRQLEQEIKDKILDYWPPKLEIVGRYAKHSKADGTPSAQYIRHVEQYPEVRKVEDGGYVVLNYVAFNIGSPDQRTEKLLELGWKPKQDERTPTGKPKATAKGHLVPSLEKFVQDSGREEPRLIASWIEINARANMINTWIEAYNDRTGCIHGSLWLANTLRYRHSNPNTANIPAVRVDKEGSPLLGLDGVFTYEARDLWTCRSSDRRLVGVDAKGIQLRVLAHYLNNPDFTKAVLDGDPHSYNQQIGGFSSRAIAKTFLYAFLLGAGDAKVGQIIGGSTRDGKDVKSRFVNNFPGLDNLLRKLEREIERVGRIKLCDGTPVLVTAIHTRLGYLLQGDESRIMKMAAILIDQEVRKQKLDVLKVCDIHDEHQYDVLEKDVEAFKAILYKAFRKAGELFEYNIPIDCSVEVGLTWSQTH